MVDITDHMNTGTVIITAGLITTGDIGTEAIIITIRMWPESGCMAGRRQVL